MTIPSVIFISTYQMLIDTYHAHASSAIAANVMVRYCFAGGESDACRTDGDPRIEADVIVLSRGGNGGSPDVYQHAASVGL
jgi:hypothetical protein